MSWLREAAAFLLPPRCLICGGLADGRNMLPSWIEEDPGLCSECISKLVPETSDRRWFLCLSEPYEGDKHPDLKLYMPFAYDEHLSRIIHVIKFGKRSEPAAFAGSLLGEIMRSDHISSDSWDAIVPIPLSDKRLLERGFNQAAVIASSVSKRTSIPMLPDVLKRVRHTARQAELRYGAERSDNVNNAFAINSEWDIKGLRIILADDVATSGNTLHEAAEVLFENDAADVLCLALCGNRIVKNVEPY